MAEAHPVGFQWVMEAKARGATVIHVDPRFTRTSALADRYVGLRAGTDIAFLGGVINYVLSNELDFREYVVNYTNAAHLVSEDFRDTEDLDGLFSGWDPETRTYHEGSWEYDGVNQSGGDSAETESRRETGAGLQHESHGPGVGQDAERDETLQHPRSVYQVLKRHFSRYTPEMVSRTCGVDEADFLAVCEAWTRNSGRERTTSLVYSVGWTQHGSGVQYIRAGAILQPAPRQHGAAGRRRDGAARARQHPGQHRRPDAVQPVPGLPAAPDRRAARQTSTSGSTRSPTATRRASGTARAVLREPLEGLLRRRRDGRERLELRPHPEAHRRPRHLPHRARHDRRQGQGVLPARPEPRRRVGPRARPAARHGQPRLARGARPVRDRERVVLEGLAGGRDGRDRARGVRHRGVPHAGGGAHREGGHLHPDAPDAAVAREGARAQRRPAQRACGSSSTSAG
ncbi:hypothetical protein GCM10025868_17230 [Angustibacter aerolatus]|uniref:Molybdopterin oxidoreductase domain-containing protein n=1 Tax=Angustibacter aerolatus TaxID=1162965 RepID=A0ABQ6JE81_9ACTN|nr:hypothetical protein GCM10025868_17230 [Angustibacter aerolatus]